MNSKVSLVIPVYNESEEVGNFFDELKTLNSNLINEIIFVDDCSNDNSLNLLKSKTIEFKSLLSNINFLILSNLKIEDTVFSIKKGVNSSSNSSIAIIDLDRTYKIEDLNFIAEQFIDVYKFKYDLITGERKNRYIKHLKIKNNRKKYNQQYSKFLL